MIREKRGIRLALRIIIILMVAFIPARAQKASAGSIRIHFRRGESSATVNGQLTSRRLKQNYLIGAREGQELSIQIKAKTSDGLDFANVMVFDSSGRGIASDDGGAVRVHLKQTGDYRIEVTPPGSFYREELKGYKQLHFSLSVKIE
jgi:hypothetical protein